MSQKRTTSTRRDFLQGKSASQAAADWAENILPVETSKNSATPEGSSVADSPEIHTPRSLPRYQIHFSRQAMACQFELILNAGQYSQGTEMAVAALDQIERIEQQLTVYNEQSETSQLNQQSAQGPVPVSETLFHLVEKSLELYSQTEHAFDITAGPLIRSWGFFRRQGSIPSNESLTAALAKVGSCFLRLDPAQQSIELCLPGMELNFGSIGKGYALDQCAAMFWKAGIDDFLWQGGQSSVLASGSPSDRESHDSPGWKIGVLDPLRPEKRLIEIFLENQALGTSGASVQFFRHEGKRYGHILDPRSGWPAEGVFSSTVLAPTAAEADALATAFYVLGPEKSREYCQQHPQIGMLMLHPSRTGGRVEIAMENLPEHKWRWASPPKE